MMKDVVERKYICLTVEWIEGPKCSSDKQRMKLNIIISVGLSLRNSGSMIS